MIAGLLVGAGACGSSGGGSKASDTTTAAADSGSGGGTSSGNADVKAYCKAVDAYVKKVKDATGDASKAAELGTQSQDLSKKAAALATAGLNADDATAVADCTKKSTDALTGG
ncbi:MAG: hypothetical protein JWM89_1708 [Acidimicrobiales bacterium]|nr:hypothetical protein [Acidimicrobiales bacterium]